MKEILHWCKAVVLQLLSFGTRKPYCVFYTNDTPEILRPNVVYIVGENQYFWAAVMLCPCGCKQTLFMPLTINDSPKWSFVVHIDKTVSLTPSIYRITGCKSHFYLRNGLIKWCK